MKRRMSTIAGALCICCGLVCSARGGAGPSSERLYAPGYYIAVDAARDYPGAIRVHGASNLPVGAQIGVMVEELVPENGRKLLSKTVCAAVNQKGLFRAEIQVTKDTYQKNDLVVDAIFLTRQCVQGQEVIRTVGGHGELLGNDSRPVTMEEVEQGETSGMRENPQLFQMSGWYFGIATLARVE